VQTDWMGIDMPLRISTIVSVCQSQNMNTIQIRKIRTSNC